jgi:hypothetical protein
MHVLIGAVFFKRAFALLGDLRKNPIDIKSVRHPILRDALDP